jgi:hypothetical protein
VKALRPYVQPGAPVTTPLDIAARPGAKTPPAPPAPDPEPELKKKPSRMKIGAAVLGAVLVLAVAGVALNRHSPPADSSLHASAETSTAPAAVTAPPPADVGNVANVANVANAAKTAASGPGTVGNTSADAPGVPASDTAPFSLAGQIIAEQGPWKLADFPPPNGGKAWFRVTSSGDPACVSYDGRACLWGMAFNDIDQTRVKELVCGEAHKKIWGATGYEDPKHWCSIVRNSEGKF